MGCAEISAVAVAVLKESVHDHRPVILSKVTPGWHPEPQILGSIIFHNRFRTMQCESPTKEKFLV